MKRLNRIYTVVTLALHKLAMGDSWYYLPAEDLRTKEVKESS